MFEEGEWGPEATTPAAPRPALLAPRPGPPAGNSREHRRRLRAVLRRLAGLAPAPDAAASSPGQERGQQAGSGAEGRRRGRRRRRPPLATTAAREEGPGAITTAAGPPSSSPSPSRGGAAAAAVVGGPGLAGARLLPSSRPGAAAAAPVGSQQGSPPAATERRRPDGPLLTRQQWRNRQKNRRRPKNKFKVAGAGGEGAASGGGGGGPSPPERTSSPAEAADPSAAPSAGLPGGGGGARASSLARLRLEQRLDSARFRYLNQQLYTCSSQEAARLSREDPEALAAYHRGFARQVARWPERPVERFVRYLRNRPASLVVADFGCGDCTLARSLRNRVHCFDLVALDPRVTVCDMAQVPLGTESVDVAVFCLALLGTNLHEILEEAHRVLCLGGTLLVAEVASRFVEVRAFVGAMAQLGFRLLSKDVSGSHFYAFEFRKVGPAPSRGSPGKPLPGLALRPCLYKRR